MNRSVFSIQLFQPRWRAVSRALAVGTRSFRKSPAVEVKNRFCFCGRRLRQPRPKGEARRIRAGILPAFRGPEASGLNYQRCRSASIASMSNPISFAKASSSHHSSGGFGIEVSPEPEINAHPLRRNAAENTKPPERTITLRPCGGETRDVRTKRLFISAFAEACPREPTARR